ncbi:hypothetical protein GALL_307240 [mine drainage metagenome]|uniref:Uncharacterized protein n=1 Tax=mine drainage metagenome TaxID=410659 RepID=A0A1J5RH34_9ZZZZ
MIVKGMDEIITGILQQFVEPLQLSDVSFGEFEKILAPDDFGLVEAKRLGNSAHLFGLSHLFMTSIDHFLSSDQHNGTTI